MSARAAWRLESLGFSQVFRYTAGKADWFANGLEREGKQAHTPRAADAARRDVPTCGLAEALGEVGDRVRAAGWDVCLVVNDEGILLGRLRKQTFAAGSEAQVEAVMEAGPTTVRPNAPLDELVARLRKRRVTRVIVSDSDGQLIGLLDCKDAERLLDEFQARQ